MTLEPCRARRRLRDRDLLAAADGDDRRPGGLPAAADTQSRFGGSDRRFRYDDRYALSDTDGSERISSVSIEGVPAGAVLNYTTTGLAVVTLVGGAYGIRPEADIRATLNSMALTSRRGCGRQHPVDDPRDRDGPDGSTTATRSALHTIVVDAVADAPTVRALQPARRTAFRFRSRWPTPTLTAPRASPRVLTASPSSLVLTWVDQTGASVATGPAGVYNDHRRRGGHPPVLGHDHRHATDECERRLFDSTSPSRPTETNPSESGEIAVLSATTSFSIPVIANADADTPRSRPSCHGYRGSADRVRPAIVYALVDTDGSRLSPPSRSRARPPARR